MPLNGMEMGLVLMSMAVIASVLSVGAYIKAKETVDDWQTQG